MFQWTFVPFVGTPSSPEMTIVERKITFMLKLTLSVFKKTILQFMIMNLKQKYKKNQMGLRSLLEKYLFYWNRPEQEM